jgi:hypothetical protein
VPRTQSRWRIRSSEFHRGGTCQTGTELARVVADVVICDRHFSTPIASRKTGKNLILAFSAIVVIDNLLSSCLIVCVDFALYESDLLSGLSGTSRSIAGTLSNTALLNECSSILVCGPSPICSCSSRRILYRHSFPQDGALFSASLVRRRKYNCLFSQNPLIRRTYCHFPKPRRSHVNIKGVPKFLSTPCLELCWSLRRGNHNYRGQKVPILGALL